MQRAKYDIGEEAVNRFSLPPEDKAARELLSETIKADFTFLAQKIDETSIEVNWSKYSMQGTGSPTHFGILELIFIYRLFRYIKRN